MQKTVSTARRRSRFQWRAFTANLLLIATLIEIVSGIYLYTPGYIASVINFNFLGMDFHQWAIWHTVFGFVFLIVAVAHIVYNWKPIVTYLKGKAKKAISYRREFFWSTLIVLFFTVTSIANWPPSGPIWDYRYTLREYWVAWGFTHTTVEDLAKNRNVPIEKALKRLEKYGIEATPESNLSELSKKFGYRPYDIYLIVRGRKPQHPPAGASQ